MNYSRSKCDTVIAAMYRDGNEDCLEALGLAEYVGHNTRKESKSEPVPTVRKPLWSEPAIDRLTTGLNYAGVASVAGVA